MKLLVVTALVAGSLATATGAGAAPDGASCSRELSPVENADSRQDVNNDAHSDLVVGIPTATVGGHARAGAVDVRYRVDQSRGGTPTTPDQRLAVTDLGGVPGTQDRFGTSVAMADVDGDYCEDLVIGAPGAADGAGRVYVVHGSVDGVTGANVSVLTGTQPHAHFGNSVVAAGRYLWVGEPDYSLDGRTPAQGRVHKFLASGTGAPKAQGVITESTPGVPGVAEAGDRFGSVLAMPSEHTVVVGEPGEDVGRLTDAGTVTVLRTDSRNFLNGAQTISQDSPTISGTAEAGDRFGAAVAAYGNYPRVAIGVPGEDVGTARDAGSAHVVNFVQGRTPKQAFAINQNTRTVSGAGETGDAFGSSVALGGFGSNENYSEIDLAVGVPGEDLGTTKDAGTVDLVLVHRDQPATGEPKPGQQSVAPLTRGPHYDDLGGRVASGDRAGASLSLLNLTQHDEGDSTVDPTQDEFDISGGDYLVVGIPGDDTGGSDAGSLSAYCLSFYTSDSPRVVRDSAGPVAGGRYGVGASARSGGPAAPPD